MRLREEPEGHLVLFMEEEALGLFVPRHEALDHEKLTKMLEERAGDMATDILGGLDL